MPVRVVDASAIIAFAFAEVRGDEVEAAVQGHELHATTLLPYELVNGARTKIRRYPQEQLTLVEALRVALSWSVTLHASEEGEELLALALETGLTAYDASYLSLAMQFGAPLVTLDGELSDAARARGLLGI